MSVLVTCHRISKHFGTRTLFEDLSISFADKERVGFLGPNGAGKTTFLRMLAGLEQSDGGELNCIWLPENLNSLTCSVFSQLRNDVASSCRMTACYSSSILYVSQ